MQHPVYTQSSVLMSTSRGIAGPPIAEWVIMTALVHWHKYNYCRELQLQHQWSSATEFMSCRDVVGQRIGIVGYGGIGRHGKYFTRFLPCSPALSHPPKTQNTGTAGENSSSDLRCGYSGTYCQGNGDGRVRLYGHAQGDARPKKGHGVYRPEHGRPRRVHPDEMVQWTRQAVFPRVSPPRFGYCRVVSTFDVIGPFLSFIFFSPFSPNLSSSLRQGKYQ